jgi:SAM-dependent methyltransferase
LSDFDIVIANAMVHPLTYEEFEQALVQFGRVLKPNGYHLNFDGFHPFEQEIAVMEYSTYGSSLGISHLLRSFTRTSQLFERAGFDRIEFHPFEMPFDLERDPQDFTNLTTYTVRTEDSKRMSMRGSIYQSWCHLYAQKRSE